MKVSVLTKSATLVLLSLLWVSARAQTPEPKPGPEHKKMEMLAGTWSYQGSVQSSPFWPTGNYKGKLVSRIVLGGFFLESKWEDKNDSGDLYLAAEMLEYDPSTKTYVGHVFENDGRSGHHTTTVTGNTWTTSSTRTDSKGTVYKTRSVWTYSPDGKSLSGLGEYSADDGKTWIPMWTETQKRTKK